MNRLLIFLDLWRSLDDEGQPVGAIDAWRIATDLATRPADHEEKGAVGCSPIQGID